MLYLTIAINNVHQFSAFRNLLNLLSTLHFLASINLHSKVNLMTK